MQTAEPRQAIMRYVFLLLLLACIHLAASQAPSPPTDLGWQTAGYAWRGTSPAREINVRDMGARGDGLTDDTEALRRAVAALEGRFGSIYFPPGQYRFTQSISLPDSVLLRGEGARQSQLQFDGGGNWAHGLIAGKAQTTPFDPLPEPPRRGTSWLRVARPDAHRPGEVVEIVQTNGEWDDVPADWAKDCVGQLGEVVAKRGDTLWLDQAFRIDFDHALHPRIRTVAVTRHIGLECLGLTRLDSAAGGYNLSWKYVWGGWIQGFESHKSAGSHIMLDACGKVSVQGSYLHDAFAFDGQGTRGYGITLIQHSSQVRVENNVFRRLRHAMSIKQGANGNVFAHNYATETRRSEFPQDLSGDISLHGHYAFANLFEGNQVGNIIVDHYWGPSGPDNCFFRNRVEAYGLIIFNLNPLSEATRSQWVMGNEIGLPEDGMGTLLVGGGEHVVASNWVNGELLLPLAEPLETPSLYEKAPPPYWTVNMPWPLLGPPFDNLSVQIPARRRYAGAAQTASCGWTPDTLERVEEPTSISGIRAAAERPRLGKIPRHEREWVVIWEQLPRMRAVHMALYALDGRKVWEASMDQGTAGNRWRLFLPPLPAGVYVFRLSSSEATYLWKRRL